MQCTELSSSCCAEVGVPLDLRRVSQEISGVAEGKSSHLSCMMWNAGLLWSQCRGMGLHLELICCTLIYFASLQGHQCSSRLVQCSCGLSGVPTRKSRVLMFDLELRIALQTLQGNRASSRCEGEFSWFFWFCGGNQGYILDLQQR